MKKLVASVGLVALGASTMQTASAQNAGSLDNTKPWSISATLRGFYDDNTATLPDNFALKPGQHRDSMGFEVSPAAAFKWALEQTTINLGFLYSLKYYDHTPPNSTDHADQSFTFNGSISHAFSEQLKIRAADSFVIGQEPDMLRAGNTFSTFQRVSGDNIRNYGSLALDAQLTPRFGLGFGYDNSLYDYKDRSVGVVTTDIFGLGAIQPSIAGTLNRMENRAHLEGTWQMMPETKGLLGYQFAEVDYNADQPIAGYVNLFTHQLISSTATYSDARNYREHTLYVGAEHNFQPNLTGSIRAGASYSDYFNDPYTDSTWTPYVLASLKYSYAPESSVEAGVSYDRNATDVVGLVGHGSGPVGVTIDAQSAVIYASLTHRITPNFFANVMGQFQNSMYHGGSYNNDNEQFYLVGLDLEYRFNPYFSAHAGYNYDRLVSDLGRGFDRNRVYIGVTASY